jgi:hypothetical protein
MRGLRLARGSNGSVFAVEQKGHEDTHATIESEDTAPGLRLAEIATEDLAAAARVCADILSLSSATNDDSSRGTTYVRVSAELSAPERAVLLRTEPDLMRFDTGLHPSLPLRWHLAVRLDNGPSGCFAEVNSSHSSSSRVGTSQPKKTRFGSVAPAPGGNRAAYVARAPEAESFADEAVAGGLFFRMAESLLSYVWHEKRLGADEDSLLAAARGLQLDFRLPAVGDMLTDGLEVVAHAATEELVEVFTRTEFGSGATNSEDIAPMVALLLQSGVQDGIRPPLSNLSRSDAENLSFAVLESPGGLPDEAAAAHNNHNGGDDGDDDVPNGSASASGEVLTLPSTTRCEQCGESVERGQLMRHFFTMHREPAVVSE